MTDLAMSPSAAAVAAPEVAAVADSVMGLVRAFTRARARMLAAAATDVEWSAHLLLKQIRADGPARAASLSDALRADPSTVSRQVSTLVKDGLLERRPDPDDGRASLLALTAKAEALLAEHDQKRMERFAEMLDGWSEADLRRFATMLSRFTDAFESAHGSWFKDAEHPAGSSN
ncbi:MAG: MarR family winged helix-turn-helix transcriptional regulator [Jatrophihabitans sp.]|uniref:MarR family winged helix-turn-helix transcriptional regulator n=1 Tax=Jatrophihabitans sp. TaxID=1932789 RepID=UPI003910D89C